MRKWVKWTGLWVHPVQLIGLVEKERKRTEREGGFGKYKCMFVGYLLMAASDCWEFFLLTGLGQAVHGSLSSLGPGPVHGICEAGSGLVFKGLDRLLHDVGRAG